MPRFLPEPAPAAAPIGHNGGPTLDDEDEDEDAADPAPPAPEKDTDDAS